jgi:hypothetical protein
MGFLSKAFKRVKKQIRPNNMMIGNIRKMPRRPGMIGDMRFRGRMPRRGGFGFGLGEAIRRLKKQRDMGMPRRPSTPGIGFLGGSLGFYDRMIGTPQPIPRAEIDISALEPLPMGEMPMTQDLPEVSPVGMMAGRTLQQDFPAEPRMMMAEGDEADSDDFPDLSGDGETTFKDVLIGRGVQLKAEGGEMMTQENEIDAMLGGMDSEESGAMEDLEQMAPEMEMIDQLVTMVVQMIQQGASEEEVIMFLREQGLDDEDIGTVLQLVAEMAEAESMPEDGIDAELEQLA